MSWRYRLGLVASILIVAVLVSCGGDGGGSRRGPGSPSPTETNCIDGVDNDGGGGVDCLDSDCANNGNCNCGIAPTPANDPDGDGIPSACDNCDSVFNPQHSDADQDGFGDACDCNDANAGVNPGATENTTARCSNGIDDDCDGTLDCNDTSCAGVQPCAPVGENCCNNADDDADGLVDELDLVDCPDGDGDGSANACDGCPTNPTKIAPGQCGCGAADTDTDGDTIADCNDNCPGTVNGTQVDTDFDDIGNACDACPQDFENDPDADQICAGTGFSAPNTGDQDNCPDDANPGQEDADGDDVGDVCDVCQGDDASGDLDSDGFCGDADCDDDGVLTDCEVNCLSNSADEDGDGFANCADPDCDLLQCSNNKCCAIVDGSCKPQNCP